jgi:hypothetical protein
MKKSTAFLKEHFRDEFTREDNYRVNGRKLAGLLDAFTAFLQKDNDLLIQENALLNDASRDNLIKIADMESTSEAKDLLIDRQSEIIVNYTNDFIANEATVSKWKGYTSLLGVLLLLALLALAYFVITYTLNISIL